METSILVIWSIGLLGALGVTLVILKFSFLALGEAAAILRLARIIREAARGLARNSEQFSALDSLRGSAGSFRMVAGRSAAAALHAASQLEARREAER